MSDSSKEPAFKPAPAVKLSKQTGREKITPEPIAMRIIHNPDGGVPETKFKCGSCNREVAVVGVAYFKPYCPKCHFEMTRDRS